MKEQTLLATWGCLLHDLGKIVYRSGDSKENHSEAGYKKLKSYKLFNENKDILDCLRYHHGKLLKCAKIETNSPAYITYIADNISASADRRKDCEEETFGFSKTLAMAPIFKHLNGTHGNASILPSKMDGMLRLPVTDNQIFIEKYDYQNILRELMDDLKNIDVEESWTNSLLSILEGRLSTIPSSTSINESPDISLYDHLKITAAAGSCISEYLLEKGISDYKTELLSKEKEFCSKKVFLLYSADFSGIQSFIYTVATADALRSLRSRSFFLELVMEHYIDEMLSACGVSRANVLYSGGGHCYLLLPNTENCIKQIKAVNVMMNRWICRQFGIRLYLADGFTPCSADELTNTPAEKFPYRQIFRRVSYEISQKKMRRYSASQIIKLNSDLAEGERECKVCGKTDKISDDGLCTWCGLFASLSTKIQNCDVYFVSGKKDKFDFSLPSLNGDIYYSLTYVEDARSRIRGGDIPIRIYTKNNLFSGLRYSTKLYVGDYAKDNRMEMLAIDSQGVSRLAVCRMDVDNLGQAFVSGFEKKEGSEEEKQKFVTISRTAGFSRQMSLFFKCYINCVLSGEFENRGDLSVAIVYSGGDDVFLVGAWTDVLEASRRIQEAFTAFTCGSLTLSAGIKLFDDHYPIRQAALETELLEAEAKGLNGKNAVSLFEAGTNNVYHWDEFFSKVMDEKVGMLESFFNDEENQRGQSFLYKMLDLIRDRAEYEKNEKRMNIARFAYLLARMEPPKKSSQYGKYKEFSKKMYDWVLDEKERKELITAIYIYVYKNRTSKKE